MAAGGRPAVVAEHANLLAVDLDAGGPGAHEQLHALLEEAPLQHGGHLGVLAREHLLPADDEGDVGTERLEHVDELHTGDARADDHQVSGQLRRGVGMTGGEHPDAVDRRPVGDAGAAAGGQHDDVRFEGHEAVVGVDLDRGG
jgi:hypothetical protein